MEAMNRYTADCLRSFNIHTLRPSRSVRKVLFRYQLWSPARTRRGTQRLIAQGLPKHTESGSHWSDTTIQVGTLNVSSIINKHTDVAEFIAAGSLDLFVAVETWHHTDRDVGIRRAAPKGYNFLERARPGSDPQVVNHGGIAIYFRDTYKYKAKVIPLRSTPATFECLCVSVASESWSTHCSGYLSSRIHACYSIVL